MNEVIISPMIQNAIVLLMGGIVTGLGTLVAVFLLLLLKFGKGKITTKYKGTN